MSSFSPHQFGRDDNSLERFSYRGSNTLKSTSIASRNKDVTEHPRKAKITEANATIASPPYPEFQDVWDSDEENGCASLYSGKSIASGPFKSSWGRSETDASSFKGNFSSNSSVASVNSKWRKPQPQIMMHSQAGKIVSYVQSGLFSLFLYARQVIPCTQGLFVKFERQNGVNTDTTSRFNELFDNCFQALRKYPAAVLMVFLLFFLYVPVTITNLEAQNKQHLQRIRMNRFYNNPSDVPPIGGFQTQQREESLPSNVIFAQKYYENEKDRQLLLNNNENVQKTNMGPPSDSIVAFHGDESKERPQGSHGNDSLMSPSKGIFSSSKSDLKPLAGSQPLLEDMFASNMGPDMEARHFAKLQGINPRTLKLSNSSRPIGSLKLLHNFPTNTTTAGLPFYWHVPKAGGSTMKQIISVCYQLVTASEVGLLPALIPLSPPLQKGELKVMVDKGGVKYVNVDTTHPTGLRHARENGLAQSGLADIVSSHLFTGSLQLFTNEVKGKAFTIFRHPIERAVSMFYYLGSEQAKHEKTYDPALKTMTIEEFSKSNKIEDNWLTRSLNGGLVGKIDRKHTFFAKEVLRTKFLIGLLPQLDESMKRFEKYFGWDNKSDDKNCVQDLVSGGMNRNIGRKIVEDWSHEYISLLRRNSFDMELFHYAEELFDAQGKYFE